MSAPVNPATIEATYTMPRRVYVSMPADDRIDDRQNRVKWAIVDLVRNLGYEVQIFTGPFGGTGLAAGRGWSPDRVDAVMRRCIGAVVLGFPKWVGKLRNGDEVTLPTEYCHYEGGAAVTCGLPVLAVVEQGTALTGIFVPGGLELIMVPTDAEASWLEGPEFLGPFYNWNAQLLQRRDVFLGYCSSSASTAAAVKTYLESLGATVLDWDADFVPAGNILSEIQDAVRRTSAGVFLFTRDDKINARSLTASPRDNVVFEAGVFAQAKGKDRVLIIREERSKMPADLGGDIYAPLVDRNDIEPIKPRLRQFLLRRL